MQTKQSKISLVWFRNDLRTRDNVVLSEACKHAKKVIAVYCFDPRQFHTTIHGFKKTEKFRAKFLIESVSDLALSLNKLNIDLITPFNRPELCIPQICNDHGVTDVFLQTEWTSEEVTVENSVKSQITGINWHSLYDQFLYHPKDLPFEIQKTPEVFTVFRKKLEKYIEIRKETCLQALSEENRITNQTKIPTLEDLGYRDFEVPTYTAFPFKGGELQAMLRIENYFFSTKKVGYYKKTRNGLLGIDYSSKLSPWLANGCISPRTIYWNIKEFEQSYFKNESTYWLIFELIWRDYFKYVSLKHGNKIFNIDGILNKTYQWSQNDIEINKWINGETTSDFVNANMIELKETGWMSNRGRQNVASYFAKDLELDWRIGAAYFESLLVDYDVHSNYGNWMYVAGVGNDPRDRKFNVQLQAERYDEHGKYRRTWLQKSLF